MKFFALGVMAAVLAVATPASAQEIRMRAGDGGISVRTDDDRSDRRWRRDGSRERIVIRERSERPDRVIIRDRRPDRVVIRERGECRNVVIRRERADGTVIVRRERRCG